MLADDVADSLADLGHIARILEVANCWVAWGAERLELVVTVKRDLVPKFANLLSNTSLDEMNRSSIDSSAGLQIS